MSQINIKYLFIMNPEELKKIISQIDACMMTTYGSNGEINSRPMLCNHTENGISEMYFFCMKESDKIEEIMQSNHISLIFQNQGNGLYINMMCLATVTEDVSEMREHWDPKLEIWWKEKEYTKGLIMIRCKTQSIRYWYQGNNGRIEL